MEKIDPIQTIKELIASCNGYCALSTTIGPAPTLTAAHGGKLSDEVMADNQLGEDFRGNEKNKGWPFTSLAQVAFINNIPLLMISDMSDHTRNIVRDNRVSLLVDGTSGKNRMNSPRVALIGRATVIDKETLKEVYLAKHRKAKTYFNFGDFTMYEVQVSHARLNGGFGKAFWVAGKDLS